MRSRVSPAACLLATTFALAACQTYERQPLDLSAHAERLPGRSVDAEGVRAFAERVRAGAAAPPFDPADGLSLDEAEVAALVLNPGLRAARLAARVPAVGAEEAARWEDPELEADLLRVLGSVERPWIAGVGIGFTLPLSGRLGAERAAAWAEADAALAEARVAEWELVGELRGAWCEWSAGERKAELYRQYARRLGRMREVVERLAEAGEAAPLEARLLRIEGGAAELESELAASASQESRLRIVRLLGLVPTAPVGLLPTLDAPPPPSGDDAGLVLDHPRVALARAEYEVAEARLRREVRKQYPDLAIGPVYEHEEGQSRLGLGLGLPLPVFNRNRRAIAEAAAGRDAARAAAEAAYEAALHEVAELRLRLGAAEERGRRLREGVAPLVDEQLREAEALVAAGELDVLLLREVLTRSLETKVRLLDAAAEEAKARHGLRTALGRLPSRLPPEEGEAP